MCEEHTMRRGCLVHQCFKMNMMFCRKEILILEMARNAEQNLLGGGLGSFCKQMEFVKILIDLFRIDFL